MLDVSVPCGSCSAPIRFRDRVCPACGARVSPDLRSALEARLEASSADFRELKENVGSASLVLLILALLHLGLGVLVFIVERRADLMPAEHGTDEALVSLIGNSTIGVAMLACYGGSRRAPVAALTAALVVWIGVNVIAWIGSPQSFLYAFLSLSGVASLFAKLVVLILLLRGLRSAYRVRALERRLASPAG